MKHILKIAFACMFSAGNMYAQQPPTGTASGPFPAIPANMTKAWLRGGNLPAGSGLTDNEFGTFFNSPIYTYTNSLPREKLNGTFTAGGATAQYPINGFTFATGVNTSGYLLLGPDAPVAGGTLYSK